MRVIDFSRVGNILRNNMKHDGEQGEKIAGLFHLGFAIMYGLAIAWHIRSFFEHWNRIKEE